MHSAFQQQDLNENHYFHCVHISQFLKDAASGSLCVELTVSQAKSNNLLVAAANEQNEKAEN